MMVSIVLNLELCDLFAQYFQFGGDWGQCDELYNVLMDYGISAQYSYPIRLRESNRCSEGFSRV